MAEEPGTELPAEHELQGEPMALIKRVPLPPAIGPHVLSDDEIRRTWRLSSALAASGMFKDARQAEVAFAKVLIGQDLGISATRALAGIDIVKGNVQLRGVLLLAFVRESKTYDYKIIELDGETEIPDVKTDAEREAKQRATLRFFQIQPDGSREALTPDITFTMAMARKQGNVKTDSAWMSARRNMLLWRAASDGVKFHCPDLLGGVPVYVEGELDNVRGEIGAGTGTGEARGVDLGPEVEAVIARATELGHAGLSDRASIETQLGDQPPWKFQEWVRAAKLELDGVPRDAEVVEPIDAADVEAPAADDAEVIEALRARALDLLADADGFDQEDDPDKAAMAREEAEQIMARVDRADTGQTTLGGL
jgi:hypothetical protein